MIEALVLTALLVGVMAFIYFSGLVKVTDQMRTIVYSVFGTMFMGSLIYMLIYFIRYHIAVVSNNDVSNLLKFLTSKHLAARIGWVAQHQSLGSLLESIFYQIGIE